MRRLNTVLNRTGNPFQQKQSNGMSKKINQSKSDFVNLFLGTGEKIILKLVVIRSAHKQ